MTTTGEKNPENPGKIRWGAHFKATREAMHLSEKDAASRLHLNVNLITLIENETFKDDTPAIFMRGYVRSYARLLNISDKHINQALIDLGLADLTTSKVSSPSLIVTKKIDNTTGSNNFTAWSTSIVVLVLVGLVGMWWNTHSRNNAADAASMAQNSTQGTVVPNATPTDPTPKELAPAPIQSAETEAPIPAPPPTAVVQSGQTPSNLPTAEQKPAGVAPATDPSAVAANTAPANTATTPTPTGETQPGAVASTTPPIPDGPAVSGDAEANAANTITGNNPNQPATDQTAQAGGDPTATPTDAPKPPVLAKKRIRHHQPVPDIDSDEMALPEPGLMEPGADPDPNETN